MALSRDQILSATTRKSQTIHIEELGGEIIVQEMSASERGRFERYFQDRKGNPLPDRQARVRELLVIHSVVDEAGNRLFSEKDVDALGAVQSSVLEALAKVAQKLSSFSDEDVSDLMGN